MLRRTSRLARTPVSVFLHEPSQRKTFNETLTQCSANGIDMASSLTCDFALIQTKLLKYRVVRLRDELQYVRQHPMHSLPAFTVLVKDIIIITLLFFVFRNVGRLSMQPLEEPVREKVEEPVTSETENKDNK